MSVSERLVGTPQSYTNLDELVPSEGDASAFAGNRIPVQRFDPEWRSLTRKSALQYHNGVREGFL